MTDYYEMERASTRGSYTRVDAPRPTEQHILDERRRDALAEIDNAEFSREHLKICFVAGIGFFTDAYNIFAINIASTMLGYVYGSNHLALSKEQDLRLKIATPVGIVIGQLFFGWLADVVGRKKMYGVELAIIIVSTFAQAVSAQGAALDIIGVLFVWRLIMGIGIGGDYPLSAVITSEFSATKFRGRMMTAVVSAQGFGNFAAALVGLIVVSAYKDDFPSADCKGDLHGIDTVWRLLIGLGCVPGVIGLFLRLTITETPRFTMDIARNIDKATHDITYVLGRQNEVVDEDDFIQRIDTPRASWADFCAHFGQGRNFKVLFGTAWSWFALDIAFYGLGLDTTIIFNVILPVIRSGAAPSTNIADAHRRLSNICAGNLILSAATLIPGYWISFLFIDTWGRKRIQLMGFVMLSVLLIILGFTFGPLLISQGAKPHVYVFLYCLANIFQNFGPNVTTFVIPGEVFPTRYRSTAYGISAASGKIGAIFAQVVFSQLQHSPSQDPTVCFVQSDGTIANASSTTTSDIPFVELLSNLETPLKIVGFIMLTGIGSTLLLPETKGRTLEELSNEKQEGFVRGGKHWGFFNRNTNQFQ